MESSQAPPDSLIRMLAEASGHDKKTPKTPSSLGLYSSVPLPGWEHVPFRRNTLKRAARHKIPEDLTGQRVVDIGSNCGHMSVLCASRGATTAGYEYNADRVKAARALAHWANLPCEFHQMDLELEVPPMYGWDIALCFAVDKYLSMDGKYQLYSLFNRVPVVYFETNSRHWTLRQCIADLEEVVGKVDYLFSTGQGNRHSFILTNGLV